MDDIVLIEKLREEINRKLKLWCQSLEAHGFCLSRNKMEHIECKFSKSHANFSLEMEIGNNTIPYHKSHSLIS